VTFGQIAVQEGETGNSSGTLLASYGDHLCVEGVITLQHTGPGTGGDDCTDYELGAIVLL